MFNWVRNSKELGHIGLSAVKRLQLTHKDIEIVKRLNEQLKPLEHIVVPITRDNGFQATIYLETRPLKQSCQIDENGQVTVYPIQGEVHIRGFKIPWNSGFSITHILSELSSLQDNTFFIHKICQILEREFFGFFQRMIGAQKIFDAIDSCDESTLQTQIEALYAVQYILSTVNTDEAIRMIDNIWDRIVVQITGHLCRTYRAGCVIPAPVVNFLEHLGQVTSIPFIKNQTLIYHTSTNNEFMSVFIAKYIDDVYIRVTDCQEFEELKLMKCLST